MCARSRSHRALQFFLSVIKSTNEKNCGAFLFMIDYLPFARHPHPYGRSVLLLMHIRLNSCPEVRIYDSTPIRCRTASRASDTLLRSPCSARCLKNCSFMPPAMASISASDWKLRLGASTAPVVTPKKSRAMYSLACGAGTPCCSNQGFRSSWS